MRPDYASHDVAYRAYRAEGRPGWGKDYGSQLALLDRILGWPGFPRAGDLLELGCGAGNVSLWLAERGYGVTGVDIAPFAIAWANENASRSSATARFLIGDVVRLPLAAAAFDVALDGHCFHCVIGDDRAHFLAEARRVLRPSGMLCIRTMCGDPPEALRERFDPSTRIMRRGDVAERYMGFPEDILREVREAGFRIDRSEVVGVIGQQELLALAAPTA